MTRASDASSLSRRMDAQARSLGAPSVRVFLPRLRPRRAGVRFPERVHVSKLQRSRRVDLEAEEGW